MKPPPATTAPLPDGVDEHGVFRSLFAAYHDALIVTDAAGVIVLANPSANRLLGYAGNDLVGLNVDELVPDGTRPRHQGYRDHFHRSPRARPMGLQMELAAKRRDGSEVMVEIALSPLDNHGQPLVVAAIRDISTYPRVKQALQRARYSEHLAQLGRLAVDSRDPQVLLDQVPVAAAAALEVEQAAVLLLEPNRLAFRVVSGLGLGAGAGAGETVGSLVPNCTDSPEGFAVAEGRSVTIAELRTDPRFVARDPAATGIAPQSALVVPLSDRGRVIGVLSVRAIQAHRFGGDELRFLESLSNLLATSLQRAQSEEALSHSQRLESVGQLTGGIAHDFNNLLTVIQGNLQVLEELPALASNRRAQELVGAATRASKRGAELTGKLLAFSRRQVLLPSAVDVSALLHSLADMLRRTLDQHIRIEVDLSPCPPCLADPGQLESALLNIAINARDAMHEGGTLHFSAVARSGLPDELMGDFGAGLLPSAEFIAIAISDTGVGMADAVKERAFEPFFTTKEAGRGTGLGLSTVYGFVRQSRGAIAISSTTDPAVGTGTTVTLYIPSAVRAASADEPADGTERVPLGLRVLLVEDDAEVRNVVRAFLETLGCRVTACISGEQALLAFEPHAPFELLLTDIALGAGMRGTQLAAAAQQRFAVLPILLMSGFSAELLDADRDSPPGWELLRKPFSRDELARAITRLLNSR